MRRHIVLATAAFALAACGSSDADADGDGEISLAEAAAQSADMVQPEPGQYRATVEVVDVEMPGAPQETQAMMKAMLAGGPQVNEFCLTREDADKGFEEVLRQSQQNEDCSFEKFDAQGGKIDAVMVCQGADRGSARIAMQGSATSKSSSMAMTMDAKGPDGQAMKMTMKTEQERIGKCAG